MQTHAFTATFQHHSLHAYFHGTEASRERLLARVGFVTQQWHQFQLVPWWRPMIELDKPSRLNSSIALERLRAIVDGLDRIGDDHLPAERDLAERIGVGRRAVRRALEVLETEGRIWRRQGSGTFIGADPHAPEREQSNLPHASNMLEVMEVRLRIEPALAQLAALRASPAQIAGMRDLAAKVAGSIDLDARELWDGALHRAIAAAAGNALFLALFDVVDRVRQDDAWRHVRDSIRTAKAVTQYQNQHAQVVDAIERRDPIAAAATMRQHLLALQERLLFQDAEERADGD
jgi:GntR family transcriptional repressor for pyruvate dehydrogenase complex